MVDEAFAEEIASLRPLPVNLYSAVLTIERRISKDGMISIGGNLYSVPDTTRRRTLEVQHHVTELVDNIRASLPGLKMPRAMAMLDHMLQRLEKDEVGAIKTIDSLLSEEFNCREDRRVGVALTTARLAPPKTLESFDFTFQPSLERDRIMALAPLDFITRAEVVHFPGQPGTGKSHLATARGVTAVKKDKSVYRATLAELIEGLSKAEREGRLVEKIRFYARLPSDRG